MESQAGPRKKAHCAAKPLLLKLRQCAELRVRQANSRVRTEILYRSSGWVGIGPLRVKGVVYDVRF
jgi:hypothetical protein